MSRNLFHRQPATRQGFAAARRGVERLESRLALSAVPLGAQPLDTGEFMLGDVAVSVVFFESNGTQDANTENWNETHRNAVKQRIEEGLAWWQETLALQSSVHELNFVIDYQYADNPIPTAVEPIARAANESEIAVWIGDFLDHVGAERSSRIDNDIRLYNHQQRLAHETNWAFTIFVINAEQDADGMFAYAPNKPRQAFSIAGGAFMALPSGRPASTIAHEAAHQFWAMDEYAGSDYHATRGYYNTQNTNSVSGNPDPVTSLLSHATSLHLAYVAHTSSPASFESIGWKDSDGDGLFDVFDVPLQFSATAGIDPGTGLLRVVGEGAVGVLPNQNSWGLQNSITINQLSHIEFRIDGGDWQIGPVLSGYHDTFDFSLEFSDSQEHAVEVRLVDRTGQLRSEALVASTSQIDVMPVHGFTGYVAHDANQDGQYTPGETGLAGWTVTVADLNGSPIITQAVIEPDDFDHGEILFDPIDGIVLSAVGSGVNPSFPQVAVRDSSLTSTGERAFFHRTGSTWNNLWSDQRRLRIDFDQPVSRVAIDALADTDGDVAQLELYDASGNLLGRYTTAPMAAGSVETMIVELDLPQAAYAVARGHLDGGLPHQGRTLHEVGLDNLQVGRSGTAVTNALGAFSLPVDITGDYMLIATPPNPTAGGFQVLAPMEVSLGTEGGAARIAFAAAIDGGSWHNPLLRADINGDGILNSEDVDTVVQELRNPTYTSNATHGSRVLSGPRPGGVPQFDINGDGRFSTRDLLTVLDDLHLSTLAAAQFAAEPGSPVFAVYPANVAPETIMFANGDSSISKQYPSYALAGEPIVDAEATSSRSHSSEASAAPAGIRLADGQVAPVDNAIHRVWLNAENTARGELAKSLRDRDELFASFAFDWDLSTDLL